MKKIIIALTATAAFATPSQAQFSAARRDYVEYVARASRSDYNYGTGEDAFIRLDATIGGKPLEGVCVYAESGMEQMTPDRRDTLVFVGGHVDIPLGTSAEPGFKACSFSFDVEGKTYKDMLKVGFSPEKIETLTKFPRDFREFWAKALKEAEKVDLAPQITPLPEYSTDKVEVSLVKLTVGPGGRNMFGYLTVPKDGKKHPVLFCPPGAGANRISPSTYYSENGYIYFSIAIHNDLNPELPEEEFQKVRVAAENYQYRGMESPDGFYYREVYAGCSRCVDFLCSLPRWDGKNVGVTGGSQGGALTIVTAALNRKVTFAAAFYPALTDVCSLLYGRAAGWPKYFREADGKDHSAEEKTLSYYDVVNFGKILECPVFLSYGYADDTCCPTAASALRNAICAPLELEITPNSAHWRYRETNDHAMAWQESLLK